jgi:DNA-binding transcriptional LysR family regulator
MELFQLNYFIETVRRNGIAQAARALNVSPPAISRAIARLEDETQCKLFDRAGRSLQLNHDGKMFLRRAEEIIQLTRKTLAEIRGSEDVSELVIAGREVFLSEFGPAIAAKLRKKYPTSVVRMLPTTGEEALEFVKRGEAHIGLVIQQVPENWRGLKLASLQFATCVGESHPLAKRRLIPIDELLQHEFISPASAIFGRVKKSGSPDGWRDDVHPRTISYVTESLEVFSQVIRQGKAIAYVPDYWAKRHGFKILSLTGCAFKVDLNVWACSRLHQEYGWLSRLLDQLQPR